MIKIIEEHHKHIEKKIYRNTCPYCGSIVEYEDEDVKNVEWLGAAISCPVCNKRNLPVSEAKVEVVIIEDKEGGEQ